MCADALLCPPSPTFADGHQRRFAAERAPVRHTPQHHESQEKEGRRDDTCRLRRRYLPQLRWAAQPPFFSAAGAPNRPCPFHARQLPSQRCLPLPRLPAASGRFAIAAFRAGVLTRRVPCARTLVRFFCASAEILAVEDPPTRQAGVTVDSVDDLLAKLKDEAKVL